MAAQRKKLPDQFIGWLQTCFTSASFRIAVNGELVGYFPGEKRLRQGDPISSLLFVLAMDILSKKLDRGLFKQGFGPHPMCIAPVVTHLSFADDVLIFFDGQECSLQCILEILEDFKTKSGLGINRTKTALFLEGGNFQRTQEMADRVGITQGALPVRYLGVTLTSKKMTRQDYRPLINRIMGRFTAWNVRHLSFAGRLQLLQ
ncbi:PREDICTED: uncharacterized protein LOC109127219 [Camelina sativa]|uniref:Uncharacterized protein LOC109127219 n=1 Tax=Camelina sativa TaxID=90675 RepID=A0ABM1QKK1_CAMSA|nr:PREDICTED: uncharacterized protein LOC109127219 [Camelina sativa]